MEPIPPTDYFSMFQTGLYIAVQVLGIKQSYLADLCNMSPAQLSKLKSWTIEPKTNRLIEHKPLASGNYKNCATPLIKLLAQPPYAVEFENGYFVQRAETGDKTWGILQLQQPDLPVSVSTGATLLQKKLVFPAKGDVSIELNFSGTYQEAIQLLEELSSHANSNVLIDITVKIPVNVNSRTSSLIKEDKFNLMSEAEVDFIRRTVPGNSYFSVEIEGQNPITPPDNLTEHITINDRTRNKVTELFCDLDQWNTLSKTSHFQFDVARKRFSGQGMNAYLLSNHHFGGKPLVINAEVSFNDSFYYDSSFFENLNAGFILGWIGDASTKKSYYNILLTGERILLEHVGGITGDDVTEFEHLDEGAPFYIEKGRTYYFQIHLHSGHIEVYVDQEKIYHTKISAPISGRIGIRPWRSVVECNYFEIREI